jgi:hypothetical protein
MSRHRRQLMVVIPALVAVVLLLWGGKWYFGRRAEISAEIARYRSGIDHRDAEISAGDLKARRQLADFAATTLAGTTEEVEATLRTAMNQLVGHVGLGKPRVSTGSAEPRRSPAAGMARELPSRDARARPDFFVVPATVSGVGSYEQAVRLVLLLRQQRCVHRIDEVSLRPVGAKKDSVEVTVAFSTAFLPDIQVSRESKEALWTPETAETLAMVADLAGRDPFRPPPDAAPVAGGAAPAPAATPARPEPVDWVVTAVVAGADGPEVWLNQSRTGQRALLTPAQPLEGVELVGIDGEVATVRVDGGLFVVRLGESLRDRKAAIQ